MSQISAQDLLHDAAGPMLRALAAAFTDELPVPIRQIMDPATTPAAFLPFLAAHRSVDLWFDDWPEARKRRMVDEAVKLAALKGTRAAAAAFLDFVDATIVHKRAYPSRFPVGRIAAGRTPIQFPTFTAQYLLKVALRAPPRAEIVGRTAIGRAAVQPFDFERLRRAKRAIVVSKAPETAYTVTFAHRVPVTLDDGFDLAAGHALGSFKDRITL